MRLTLTRRDVLKSAVAAGSALQLSGAETNTQPNGFKLGIITDELTGNLEEALPFLSSYHLHWCELREMWGKNIMNLSPEELDRAKKLIAKHDLHVSDIASPIFKWNLPKMPAHADEKRDSYKASFVEDDANRLLEDSFKLARFFGTRQVRIFSYWRVDAPEKAYSMVRDRLALAAQLAVKNDIVLVLENEHTCNIGTGGEMGPLLKEIASPGLRGNWDPGNAAMLDEVPYPHGYQAVKGFFSHVHIKDVRKNAVTGKKEWAPVGGGYIDWKGQMQALRNDHYDGTMSLETHYLRSDRNKVESTRESLDGLLKILA
jgi:sugar phosphate isomerase/epimerase